MPYVILKMIGIANLEKLAKLGFKWAMNAVAKLRAKDKDEPKQADDDFITKTKDV